MGALKITARLAAGALAGAFCVLAAFATASHLREQVTPPGDRASVPAEDTRFAYSEWGDPDGPPVVLVHGSFAWSRTWDVLAEPLARQGYRVVAFDVPPFGYSVRPDDAAYSRQAQSRRILAAATSLGIDRFVLIAHSFGAGAAVEAALSDEARIKGLVLVGAALALDDPSGGGLPSVAFAVPGFGGWLSASTFANPLLTGHGLRSFVHDDAVATAERIALYQQPLQVEGTAAHVAAWLSGGLYGDESMSRAADRSRYREFRPPVLLVWGEEDEVTPPRQARDLHRMFPESWLVELPGVGHIPHLERPSWVAASVLDFLGVLGRSTATEW